MHYLAPVTDDLWPLSSRSATSARSASSSTATCAPWTPRTGTSFEECFVPEATGDYNGLVFDDRAALVAYMRENLGEGLLTLHQAHHPEIEVGR